MRKFGLNPKNRKEPFEWDDVVRFAVEYGVRQQGYCHLVVATMAVLMFGGMCRYDDASGLQWRNVRFLEDRSAYESTFDKRKNAQYRQGNKFATQSGRSGGASAAANAEVPAELWGQHGDWKTMDAQKRYMKTHPTRLLSVSRAAMGLLRYPAPGAGIGVSGSNPPGAGEGIGESGSNPPGAVEEDILPDVVGVPEGAFVWT